MEEMELSELAIEQVRNLDIEVDTNELVVFWLKSIVFTVLGVILRKLFVVSLCVLIVLV